MKFATLFLLATLIGLASFCVFQREYLLKRGESIVQKYGITEATCFAECLNTKECTNLCYMDINKGCILHPNGEEGVILKPNASRNCYTLHRDKMERPQYTRILTFTRRNLVWVP